MFKRKDNNIGFNMKKAMLRGIIILIMLHYIGWCFYIAGIEAKVVQGFLGHYSIAITLDLYTHVTNDKGKSEMDKLQNLYQNII